MRSSFSSRSGVTLLKTPSHRQQTTRRRLVVICTVLAMALASGLIGSMTHSRGEVTGRAHTGPFSYFPSE